MYKYQFETDEILMDFIPILALATLEMVLMVFKIEFFPANPRPAVTREPPARPGISYY